MSETLKWSDEDMKNIEKLSKTSVGYIAPDKKHVMLSFSKPEIVNVRKDAEMARPIVGFCQIVITVESAARLRELLDVFFDEQKGRP